MDIGLDANNMKILNLTDVINLRQDYHNIDENKKSLLTTEGIKQWIE